MSMRHGNWLCLSFESQKPVTPLYRAGDPKLAQENSVLCPDFSPHPTHREWSVSSGAVAPSEGTPCASAHAELQGSYTQENQG